MSQDDKRRARKRRGQGPKRPSKRKSASKAPPETAEPDAASAPEAGAASEDAGPGAEAPESASTRAAGPVEDGAAATDAAEAEADAAVEADADAVEADAAEADAVEAEQADNAEAGEDAPAERSREELKRTLESLVFVADRSVTAVQLGRIIKIRAAEVRELLDEVKLDYEERGIQLHEVGGGYQFRSAPSSAQYVRVLVAQRPVRLTRAQLETLALVAYRQPITRPEIDEVRGVDTGSAVRVLLERGLIKLLGRKDEAGRPLLYGTTPFFLEFFGMNSLKDLPTLREFTELSEENRALFQRKTGDAVEDVQAELAEIATQQAAAEAEAGEVEVDTDASERAAEAEAEADTDAGDADADAAQLAAEAGEPAVEGSASEADDDAGERDEGDPAADDDPDRPAAAPPGAAELEAGPHENGADAPEVSDSDERLDSDEAAGRAFDA